MRCEKAALALRQSAAVDSDPPSAAQLNTWLMELGQLPYPRIIRSTFRNLVSTGELAKVGNRSLVLQLTDFYEQVELVDVVIEHQGTVYTTTFEPYVVKNVGLRADPQARNCASQCSLRTKALPA